MKICCCNLSPDVKVTFIKSTNISLEKALQKIRYHGNCRHLDLKTNPHACNIVTWAHWTHNTRVQQRHTTMAIWKLVLDALTGLLIANLNFLLWYPIIFLACVCVCVYIYIYYIHTHTHDFVAITSHLL